MERSGCSASIWTAIGRLTCACMAEWTKPCACTPSNISRLGGSNWASPTSALARLAKTSPCGQVESTVCVGDVYRIGSSTVQVSQPRGPCWKVARRWHRPDLTRRVLDTGRTGWYLRVLSPCLVVPGDMIDLIERPHPEWTIQRTNNLSYVFETSAEARRALTTCTALADAWRASLRE